MGFYNLEKALKADSKKPNQIYMEINNLQDLIKLINNKKMVQLDDGSYGDELFYSQFEESFSKEELEHIDFENWNNFVENNRVVLETEKGGEVCLYVCKTKFGLLGLIGVEPAEEGSVKYWKEVIITAAEVEEQNLPTFKLKNKKLPSWV